MTHQSNVLAENSYDHLMDKVTSIAKDSSVFYFGKPYSFTSDASIGPLIFAEVEMETAQLIAYQIPYYFTKKTNSILQFTSEIKPNQFYIARKKQLTKYDVEIFYEFWDDWEKFELVLFKLK